MNIDNLLVFMEQYSLIIIFVLCIFVAVLFLLFIIAIIQMSIIKKRFSRFMRPKSKTHNVEAMLLEYIDEVRAIKESNSKIVVDVADLNNKMKNCIQKVGVVKYNSFDDVGGDLSYSIAFLDEKNDGIVFNSLYYRDGCYTYGKEVIDGKAAVKLSNEEQQAIDKALSYRELPKQKKMFDFLKR